MSAGLPAGAAAVGQAQWQRLARLPAALARLRDLGFVPMEIALPPLSPGQSSIVPLDLPGVAAEALLLAAAGAPPPGLLLQAAMTAPGNARLLCLNAGPDAIAGQPLILRLAALHLT